ADADDHEDDDEGQGQEHVPPVLEDPGLFRCRHADKYVRRAPGAVSASAGVSQPPLSGGTTNTGSPKPWNNSGAAPGWTIRRPPRSTPSTHQHPARRHRPCTPPA